MAFPDGFQSIQRFNQYILDVCDSLWRNKAFIDRDKSFCFSMPRSVVFIVPWSAFQLSDV